MNTIRKPVLADYAYLLLVSAIWGASFICIDLALVDFSPLAIACWRIILAALVLLIICWKFNYKIPLQRPTLILFVVIGLLNTVVPFTLIGWGQQTVNSAVTALLIATTPFATLILSHVMTGDDRFSLNRLFGVLIGFSGIVLMFAHELFIANDSLLSMLAILFAAVCYSFSSLLIRRLAHLPSLVIATGAMLVTGIALIPVVIWHAPPWQQSMSSSSASAMLFLTLGPTAAAYVLRAHIVQTNGAVFVSNCGYLIPVFATAWAWLFFGESPSLAICGAIVLIFIGIVMGQRR